MAKYNVVLEDRVIFSGTLKECQDFIESLEWDADGTWFNLPAADAVWSAHIEKAGVVKIVNLTPHVLNLFTENGEQIVVPTSGTIARVSVKQFIADRINGLPVYEEKIGEVEGLPAPEEGVVYVVSRVVAAALKGSRPDVLVPGALRRDPANPGTIIGATGLAFVK